MISSKEFCSISNGSACTSKSYDLSYVLKAMGIADESIENSLRLSWGAGSDKDEVLTGVRQLVDIAKNFAG